MSDDNTVDNLRTTIKAMRQLHSGISPKEVAKSLTSKEKSTLIEARIQSVRVNVLKVILFALFILWTLSYLASCAASAAV